MRIFRCFAIIYPHMGVCEKGLSPQHCQVVLQTSAECLQLNSVLILSNMRCDQIPQVHDSASQDCPWHPLPTSHNPSSSQVLLTNRLWRSEVTKISLHSGCQVVTCSSEPRKPIYSPNYWFVMKVSLQCCFCTAKWISCMCTYIPSFEDFVPI